MSEVARKVLAVTSAHIAHAAEHLPEGFNAAVDLILATEGRLVFTGLGKSGIAPLQACSNICLHGHSGLFCP